MNERLFLRATQVFGKHMMPLILLHIKQRQLTRTRIMHPYAAAVSADEVCVVAFHREVVNRFGRRVPNRSHKPRDRPRPRDYRVANRQPTCRNEAFAINVVRCNLATDKLTNKRSCRHQISISISMLTKLPQLRNTPLGLIPCFLFC